MPFRAKADQPNHTDPVEFTRGFGHHGLSAGTFNPAQNVFQTLDSLGIGILDEAGVRKNALVNTDRLIPVGDTDAQGKPIRNNFPPEVTNLRGVHYQVTNVSANYQVKKSDSVIAADSNPGNLTVTLPKGTTLLVGTWIHVTKVSAGNVVTIQSNAGDNIEGLGALTLNNRFDSFTLILIQPDTWHVMAQTP